MPLKECQSLNLQNLWWRGNAEGYSQHLSHKVTGWLQRPQDSRSLRVRNPVFQKRQNAASPFTSLVFCLSCCGHWQILSHPLQLFLTWTCSVICFTHSTEMAQLREQVNPRSVCSHLHARPASQSQGSALLPETFQPSPCARPLTVLRVDQGHHLPFCSRGSISKAQLCQEKLHPREDLSAAVTQRSFDHFLPGKAALQGERQVVRPGETIPKPVRVTEQPGVSEVLEKLQLQQPWQGLQSPMLLLESKNKAGGVAKTLFSLAVSSRKLHPSFTLTPILN
ncbi:uncharacterized protein LOC121063459 [Cygnus olor]|uniref:uncharacterized protein LOC121063459 n=1 Tax=Cygnus olor TaxID=8869 RepID=UPI001ADE5288|nr:uncharacterized protein LOC121063459 [Cygnus olor]